MNTDVFSPMLRDITNSGTPARHTDTVPGCPATPDSIRREEAELRARLKVPPPPPLSLVYYHDQWWRVFLLGALCCL
jgi:hypothetical protein